LTCENTVPTACTPLLQQTISTRTPAENRVDRRRRSEVSEQFMTTSVGDLEAALIQFQVELEGEEQIAPARRDVLRSGSAA
jgi:hypothetical protein